MVVKSIDFLVLQEGKVSRLELAGVDLDDPSKISYYLNPEALDEKLWTGVAKQYDVHSLSENYLETIRRVQKLYRKINPGYSKKEVLELITEHPFVYAAPKAYQLVKPVFPKEKNDDAEIHPIAHISWEQDLRRGIFISLEDHFNRDTIIGSSIHEHGHYLHFRLAAEKYKACDSTLKELMAIFVQRKCDYDKNYGEKTPHHRALQLLQQLEQTKYYSSLNSKDQWNFLIDFKTHTELQEKIESLSKASVPEFEVELELPHE